MTSSIDATPDRDPPIRVVVVDGHDLFRSGLVAILGSEPDIQVVGHASRATLGIQLTLELRGQVVLLDMDMPDIEGVSAIHAILAEAPQTRVIALSATSGRKEVENDVATAVLAGACGFLLKGTPIGDVVAAIRAAAIGGSWLSPLGRRRSARAAPPRPCRACPRAHAECDALRARIGGDQAPGARAR